MGITVGDPAPDFTVEAHDGSTLHLADVVRDNVVVLYFYPKDETPGCTVEARAFRDLYEEFVTAGAVVIGVSHDSQDRHRSFALKHDLPFFLVSDVDGRLREQYAVPKSLGLVPGRTTFVIDRDGIVRMKFDSMLRPTAHVRKALDMVRALV